MVDELLRRLRAVAARLGEVRLMEVCGGHTHTIMRYGLRDLIPENVKLISGPGCPVCVTAQEDIDCAVALAQHGVKIATYGDLLAVPGSEMSLRDARRAGADVQAIYSIDQIDDPDRVFFAVGFETTTPMTARLLERGHVVLSAHKVMPPALQFLAAEMRIDGFIAPGHVSAITGSAVWEELSLPVPLVIAGFRPEQLLNATLTLLELIAQGRAAVVNEYPEVVPPQGNPHAQALVQRLFKPVDANWRGIGVLPRSGLSPREARLDARIRYADLCAAVSRSAREDPRCRCGDVIRGLCEPQACPLFGTDCTPEHPRGACMVSENEGACAIAYRFGRSLG